ncbi:hypothetical protein Tco_0277622 [Tanacetum coccineum]
MRRFEVGRDYVLVSLDGEGEAEFVDPIKPWVTVIEDDLEVLDFDSLESDLENVPENARRSAHCDMLINNVCEVFNRQLLDARDSPIITFLEFVREYLMKRIVIVQKVIQKCDGPLTLVVTKLFNNIKEASTEYTID